MNKGKVLHLNLNNDEDIQIKNQLVKNLPHLRMTSQLKISKAALLESKYQSSTQAQTSKNINSSQKQFDLLDENDMVESIQMEKKQIIRPQTSSNALKLLKSHTQNFDVIHKIKRPQTVANKIKHNTIIQLFSSKKFIDNQESQLNSNKNLMQIAQQQNQNKIEQKLVIPIIQNEKSNSSKGDQQASIILSQSRQGQSTKQSKYSTNNISSFSKMYQQKQGKTIQSSKFKKKQGNDSVLQNVSISDSIKIQELDMTKEGIKKRFNSIKDKVLSDMLNESILSSHQKKNLQQLNIVQYFDSKPYKFYDQLKNLKDLKSKRKVKMNEIFKFFNEIKQFKKKLLYKDKISLQKQKFRNGKLSQIIFYDIMKEVQCIELMTSNQKEEQYFQVQKVMEKIEVIKQDIKQLAVDLELNVKAVEKSQGISLADISILFQNILNKRGNLQIYQVTAFLYIFYGKLLLLSKDNIKSIALFRQAKFYSNINNNFRIKIECFKGMGQAFQNIHNYQIAKFYFIKVLQTSWLLRSINKELRAYELIGLQYFYQGDIAFAKYYHKRCLEGIIEPKNSPIRELSLTNLYFKKEIKQKFEFKSEDELIDLESTEFSSDEEFQLPFEPKNNKQEINNFQKNTKQYDYFLMSKQQINFLANKYIHFDQCLSKYTNMPFDMNKLHKVLFLIAQNARNKNKHILNPKIFLSHLSTNKTANEFCNNDQQVKYRKNQGHIYYQFKNGEENEKSNEKLTQAQILVLEQREKFKPTEFYETNETINSSLLKRKIKEFIKCLKELYLYLQEFQNSVEIEMPESISPTLKKSLQIEKQRKQRKYL